MVPSRSRGLGSTPFLCRLIPEAPAIRRRLPDLPASPEAEPSNPNHRATPANCRREADSESGATSQEQIMSKTHPLGFRIERDIKEALVRAAKDDHRSVSSLVELVMARWLRERGYLADDKNKAA
jgi:hypothetical protein